MREAHGPRGQLGERDDASLRADRAPGRVLAAEIRQPGLTDPGIGPAVPAVDGGACRGAASVRPLCPHLSRRNLRPVADHGLCDAEHRHDDLHLRGRPTAAVLRIAFGRRLFLCRGRGAGRRNARQLLLLARRDHERLPGSRAAPPGPCGRPAALGPCGPNIDKKLSMLPKEGQGNDGQRNGLTKHSFALHSLAL